ncbi:MAG: IS3 family transposase, partial [Actinobacteria bacterium]|nr:IS3 family transposase [Actinomycetota bacterium]
IYRLMDAEKAKHPIAVMARVLGVSTSGFYGWKAKGSKLSARAARDEELTETIRQIHVGSRKTYGGTRVQWS